MQGHIHMQDGTEHKVGSSWPEIECFRCGVCCTRYRPRTTPEEIELIARNIDMSTEVFMSTYARAAPEKGVYLLQTSTNACPFLRWDEESARATCYIHSFRPNACRDWVPSLSRPECRDGLTRLGTSGELLLPCDTYSSGEDIERLAIAVRDDGSV